ncbi:MAG: hypothetical protein KAT62_13200 [Desulfuromonadales bacterium]|nr:hypothetical protein [Desulfuromonadales bacterium]
MLKKIILSACFLALFGCSDNQPTAQLFPPEKAAAKADATQETPAAAEHYLVFFLDPKGGPCRMQDTILNDMADELKGKVNLHYVQTTIPDDRQYFYAFGVRSLPTLLLADADGKEIKRLPPGVNPAAAVRDLLKTIPN